MSAYRRIAVPFLTLLWAGYMALAQPGLPPCWLEAQACRYHPHFSREHAESHHTHDYLFDMAKANAALGLPPLLLPVAVLIELAFLSTLLRGFAMPSIVERTWISSLDPPPPRSAFPS